MQKHKRVLFYYLSAFSLTGGIEKFNRNFIKALCDISDDEEYTLSFMSVYDHQADTKYLTKGSFEGFLKNRSKSIFRFIQSARKYDLLIIGHINLAVAGLIMKMINPSCKVVVVAHGVEVWNKLLFQKKLCLQLADKILSVSTYTKNQLVINNNLDPSKILLFPNTIDPFFDTPEDSHKPQYLLDRYALQSEQKIIFTLSRLSASEHKKGYDQVIAALPAIIELFPNCVYIIAGKYEAEEKQRLEELIQLNGVKDHVRLIGFITDAEVIDHYRLADVFIMPSRKEGFGIVFLEAMLCGTPVIGGNQDGSVEALSNGTFGYLINPTKQSEIIAAIVSQLSENNHSQRQKLQRNVVDKFGFSSYKKKLQHTLKIISA